LVRGETCVAAGLYSLLDKGLLIVCEMHFHSLKPKDGRTSCETPLPNYTPFFATTSIASANLSISSSDV
jgi:hypothetical protein